MHCRSILCEKCFKTKNNKSLQVFGEGNACSRSSKLAVICVHKSISHPVDKRENATNSPTLEK